jgi:hypothetical protein
MILNALVEKLKRRSKDDFKGRHFEATLILQPVSWYLRDVGCPISGRKWDSSKPCFLVCDRILPRAGTPLIAALRQDSP